MGHTTSQYGQSFFPKTISAWNGLAFAEAPSLAVFRSNFIKKLACIPSVSYPRRVLRNIKSELESDAVAFQSRNDKSLLFLGLHIFPEWLVVS